MMRRPGEPAPPSLAPPPPAPPPPAPPPLAPPPLAPPSLAPARPTRGRRGPFALLLAVCAATLLVLPSAAAAHAVLVTSTPSWNAVVRATPRQVTLTYDEDVVPTYARVTVVVGTASRDVAGPPRVSGNVVVVDLGPGGTGSYTVRWRMVASDDGHVTQGAFSFGVGAKPLPPAPAKGVSVPVAPQLLAWLQFLGVVLAGGTLTFRVLVLAPAARALGERGDREASLAIGVAVVGRSWRCTRVCSGSSSAPTRSWVGGCST